ncbi:radical SAM protein [Azohydromonas caseinilytica]|uniref:Radical SAM protein n=1 Tax=Azohydromonas caseinilytica TaxID=2728836 RepID=A0A848F6D0_9BURK|nr:radical SAM protein [Azohydromonas caseinilytica]NML14246.1 radical SAM protein [Azohydromonas caseinilytica]
MAAPAHDMAALDIAQPTAEPSLAPAGAQALGTAVPQPPAAAAGSGTASVELHPPLPRFAQIEPVGRCNLACRMCTVNERGDTVAELPLERFVELLDQMPGLEELHLQGLGEPMLHPQFFEMVELAAARGIRVSANTNLTLLTPKRAARCVDSGLSALSVSLDGATAATYESIRRKASFAKVVRNLGRLMQARQEAGSTLEVRGVMVLMRHNAPELPALLRLLHAHGVAELLVQRLSSDLQQPELPARYIPIRSYVNEHEIPETELPALEALFAESRTLASALGIRLHLPRLRARTTRSSNGPRCDWPWEQLYITAAGQMLPCCMAASADRATFGDVFTDPQGLQGRWHGEQAVQLRAALVADQPPSLCRSCALYRGMF